MKEKQNRLQKVKRKVRKKTLFFLILTFIASSFSWFIYTNIVSNSINTHIKSWKVSFKQGEDEIESVINFRVDTIYPGMEEYNDSIVISNDGETGATVSYEIISLKILNDTFTNEEYTSAELESMLENNYPFKILFTSENSQLTTGEQTKFSVNVTWPYESGDDEADTYWGKESYQFKEDFPDETQIVISVKIKAVQA